jgi:hypothetical protein
MMADEFIGSPKFYVQIKIHVVIFIPIVLSLTACRQSIAASIQLLSVSVVK